MVSNGFAGYHDDMTIQTQAVYVQGTLRLLEPVGLSDNQQVTVLITEKEPTRQSILSDEEFDHLLVHFGGDRSERLLRAEQARSQCQRQGYHAEPQREGASRKTFH